MTHSEKFINEMYDYAKKMYWWKDIYDMYDFKRLYNYIAETFNLDIAFWIDWNDDWDEIYCYTHVNNIGSIVFDWSCKTYTDSNFYKDTVNG